MVWTAARMLVLCLAGVLGIQSSMAAGQAGNAWTVLLDGTSLTGWNVVGDANWAVVDKAVQADKGSGFLVTPVAYRDCTGLPTGGGSAMAGSACPVAVTELLMLRDGLGQLGQVQGAGPVEGCSRERRAIRRRAALAGSSIRVHVAGYQIDAANAALKYECVTHPRSQGPQ